MMISSEPYLLSFLQLPDTSGALVSTQDEDGLPFAVKRVFWVFASQEGTARGGHAHKTTEEILVVLQGTVEIETETTQGKKSFELSKSTQGLYIPPLCWISVYPSPNAILCCMTSTVFEEADYIRDYLNFQKLVL